jgi:hypothetical protein
MALSDDSTLIFFVVKEARFPLILVTIIEKFPG